MLRSGRPADEPQCCGQEGNYTLFCGSERSFAPLCAALHNVRASALNPRPLRPLHALSKLHPPPISCEAYAHATTEDGNLCEKKKVLLPPQPLPLTRSGGNIAAGMPHMWAPPHGRQASTISLEVCRVRDRQGGWGGHFEGQTVSQLHQNTLQTPQNTQKPADCQQHAPPYTSCGRSSTPCPLSALLGPAIGSLGRPQTPCHHFNKDNSQNQCPLAAAVAVFSQKPSQPQLG
jgi:hypothetical protein